jgi:hypothetical protein
MSLNLYSHPTEFKRKYPRKSFRKFITFVHAGKVGSGSGVEIGEGGMSFKTSRKLNVKDKAIVNLYLTEDEFFSIQLTLLNETKYGSKEFIYGASFDEVSVSLKRQIRTYVARTLF